MAYSPLYVRDSSALAEVSLSLEDSFCRCCLFPIFIILLSLGSHILDKRKANSTVLFLFPLPLAFLLFLEGILALLIKEMNQYIICLIDCEDGGREEQEYVYCSALQNALL